MAGLIGLVLLTMMLPSIVSAHNVSTRDVNCPGEEGIAVYPLISRAQHMVTGYDHLLFLLGVIFFLYRLKDVILYVSLFTIGHSVTLLAGVFAGIQRTRTLSTRSSGFPWFIRHSTTWAVLNACSVFSRIPRPPFSCSVCSDGFGLATKLQELALAQDGLVTNIISFNVGVEIGQVLALTAVLIGLSYWRTRSGFLRHAFMTNALLDARGTLVGYQITGYWVTQ